jgi:hypothetical protein
MGRPPDVDEYINAQVPCDDCGEMTPCRNLTRRYIKYYCPRCISKHPANEQREPAPPISAHPRCAPGHGTNFDCDAIRRVRADPPKATVPYD